MLLLADNSVVDRHESGPGHPERHARLTAALDAIPAAGLADAVVQLEPRRAEFSELSLVHSPSYLLGLKRFCEEGGGALDADTFAGTGSWETATFAAGALLEAVDALRRGEGEVAFVAARPPGHHALADRSMGFCLINTVAVAARSLAQAGERVAIVDWDVHHGNGTQAIFWDDPRVLYMSTHQWPLYPGTGAADETGGPNAEGLTVNVPLASGATGDVLLRAFDEVLAPAADAFQPDWVLVSAGYDGHRADPLASLALTAGDYADLATRVASLAPRRGRLAFVLEGGYDLDAIRMSVGATLSAALGGSYRPEPSSSGSPR